MSRSSRMQQTLPLGVLAFFTLVDLAIGREQQLLSLLVISPLVAATFLGRRATLRYAVLALVMAALLGIYDRQYTSEAVLTQTVRLFGIALGGGVALVACTLRLRHEAQVRQLSAQAASTRAVVQVAEALQRNLLGDAPRVPALETAVRYLPAARHAEVGGDWYDAFRTPEDSTMLVIGDVAGHDAPAAAVMAQARGMLRGIAQCRPGSPAAVLTAMDLAFARLDLATLVTVVVATVECRPDGSGVLRWSNAGHPPPALICADGRVELLERPPDRLLGVSADAPRTEHEVPLRPGDAALFYTDGLVERRGAGLDDGTTWLLRELSRTAHEPLERVRDVLLASLDGRVDDDVALLAVRLPAR